MKQSQGAFQFLERHMAAHIRKKFDRNYFTGLYEDMVKAGFAADIGKAEDILLDYTRVKEVKDIIELLKHAIPRENRHLIEPERMPSELRDYRYTAPEIAISVAREEALDAVRAANPARQTTSSGSKGQKGPAL